MPLPTINDVQAVDPVLTNMLVAYMQAATRFVASRVFPEVPVEKDSGTYYIVTKKYFMSDTMLPRAPGDDFTRSGFGVSTTTYTTLQQALATPIADEVRANSQVPMELESLAIEWLALKNLIKKERAFAADFMTTSVWETDDDNSTTDWDDFSNGDPVADIKTAIRTISNSTGYKANTLVCGAIVDDALTNHPDILDRIKYVQVASAGNVTNAMADVFGLESYLPAIASYNSADEGQSFTASAIIDDDALVTYVKPGSVGTFSVTAGKTFTWLPGGGSGLISVAREDTKDSDLVKMKAQWDQKAVATDLGYFFSDVV
jgi:hypothetical protein